MNRLEQIRERYERYTDLKTNTDEKLENGAISDWTFHGDDDMGWLLERVDELLEACIAGLDALENILSSEFATHKNPRPEDDNPAVLQLRAAIAKATGGK